MKARQTTPLRLAICGSVVFAAGCDRSASNAGEAATAAASKAAAASSLAASTAASIASSTAASAAAAARAVGGKPKAVLGATAGACPTLPASGLPDPATIAAYGALCDGTVAALGDPQQAAVLAWTWLLWLQQPVGAHPRWLAEFEEASQIYLPAQNGTVPAPTWAPLQDPPAAVLAAAQAAGITGPLQALPYDQQANGQVLPDNDGFNVRYQIRMNRSAFDTVSAGGLYSRAGQTAAAKTAGPGNQAVNFAENAWELKSAWVWLPTTTDAATLADLKTRYIVMGAWWNAGTEAAPAYQVGYAALTGLHATNKAVPPWAWLTFEQLDDTKLTTAVRHAGSTPSAAAATANTRFQAALAASNSPWAHYSLIGIQSTYVENGQPTILANSQIESAFQDQSSCITCHTVSAISGTTGAYFNLVDPTGKGLAYYVGAPPLDRMKAEGFSGLDAVWSFRHAH